jgi:oxygen-independent coproporphyrinogen-3 oxidase
VQNRLIKKYNVPGPRYTSYPTVPYWDAALPAEEAWKLHVKQCFIEGNPSEGISLYIHLPFCESLCTYCGCNTRITKNHSVEVPYIVALLKEWSKYLDLFEVTPRIKELHLGGGTPTFFSAEHLKQLVEGITATVFVCHDAEFSFEGHPNNTTEAHLQTMYNLGFRRVSFGIQDFDPIVQKTINRIQPFETVEKVTGLARHLGYTSINFDLIYGLPFQTRKSIIETINKVRLLRPDRIAFYSYAHVPWIKPSQRKFTEKDLPLDIEKRALYEIGREKFREDGYEEIGMDHFALRSDALFKAKNNKTLHRNFMGYTTCTTNLLVGLGVSSISDCWTGIIQNVKTLDDYYKLMEEWKFPFFRGHILTQEDKILRKHILNIMCHGETSWKNENEQCDALYESLERLGELEEDGLVIVTREKLRVKAQGMPFLRNICMAFDARLWKSLPQSKLFSMAV